MKLLLACKAPPFDQLRYPLLASPKLDGIRCIMVDGKAMSRRMLPIPNRHVQECLRGLPDGLDGELLLPDMTAPFREVSSAVMSYDGEPDFRYAVFDQFHATKPYSDRLEGIDYFLLQQDVKPVVMLVSQVTVIDPRHLAAVVARHAADGYEGTMLRSPDGRYKQGRSTEREQILMKVKSFDDEEAKVLSCYEAMENLNEKIASGRRGSGKEGKVPKGHLGGIECVFDDGTVFGCGSGFTLAEREYWWQHQDELVGKSVTIKHQPPPGGRKHGEDPRFPVFKGVRHD